MSRFRHQQSTEIHQYVQVVNWLREQIVSGRIALGAITVIHVHE